MPDLFTRLGDPTTRRVSEDLSMTSRRTLLRAAATTVVATAATSALGAAPAVAAPKAPARRFGSAVPAPRTPSTPPAPSAAIQTGEAFALHLVRRTTYGATPELLDEVRTLGTATWLERQLTPDSIDDVACDLVLARFPHYFSDPQRMHAEHDNGSWAGMQDTIRAAFSRACWSKRQLLEVMVDFWSNHLNTTAPSSEVWSSKGWEDRHVIRPHALGRFSDMLLASGRSPAMLRYLDGAESKKSNPNENYGRELLELHTVGRTAGYAQADVVAAARALTGRTTWTPWNGGLPHNVGTFRYRADWHHVGPLKVLGWSHPNGSAAEGAEVGDSLLRYLATHPATAARIARKLCVRFVADEPPQALVDRLAAVYLASDTAIVPVLRALFTSPEFAASAGQKYRRPLEDVVASVRILGIEPGVTGAKAVSSLCWELQQVGHAPFGWHPPDGYPDVAAAWTGTGNVLGRWNLHVGLAQGWWKEGLHYPGTSLYARLLPGAKPASRAELVTATASRLLPGSSLPAAHRDALVTFLGGPGPVRSGDTGGLYPILVALLLDSPAWSVR
jgi:uncharacterized protein (DUF1800 family)